MDLELFKTLSKYPFVFEKEFFNSGELTQNKTCLEKCKEKDCNELFKKNENLAEYICSKQYDNLLIVVGDLKFILNGLIYKTNKNIPAGRKEVRQEWIVDRNAVLLFAKKIQEIENHITNRVNETTVKNISMFHDFKTSMNIFYKCTQDIISKLPGNTFEQKLEQADKSIKDLYNALDLITSQLGMIDVFVNPQSIKFGELKEINIFKLFHKMSILFKHFSFQEQVGIELTNVENAYIHNSMCYESIEFIPLILLDNAIKYSAELSTVKIEISQHYHKVRVKVKNIGPFVSDENHEKIFEKFFRDDSAKKFSREGMGMGLWIAQQILAAHNSKLSYHRDTSAVGEIGLNIFEFELATNY